MFIDADIQPVRPIVRPVASIPGLHDETPTTRDTGSLEKREDAERFEEEFIKELNLGLIELKELYCPDCSEEEWKVVSGATAGFVLQVMYPRLSPQQLNALEQRGEHAKAETTENLKADIKLLKENPQIFNTLTSLALASWGSYERFSNNMRQSLKNTNTGDYIFDPTKMDSPARGLFVSLTLGYNLSPAMVENIFYSLVYAPSNSNGTAGSIFAHVNDVKYGFVWARDRKMWHRMVLKPYMTMLGSELGIDPNLSKGKTQVHYTYGKPQRDEVWAGGRR